jgi:hypothetical protein
MNKRVFKAKVFKAKLLRKLRITKPIELTKYEVQWIKLIKCHYTDKWPMKGNWVDNLKPLFKEIYAYDPDDYPNDYRDCMFTKLLDIHLKIQDDESGNNMQIKEIIRASFSESYRRPYPEPIDRVISEICGHIQSNTVIKNGVNRYYL